MAHFAKIENNTVIKVESVVNELLKDSNGVEKEQIGIDFLKTLYNEPDSIWKQTSYNTYGGIHSFGKTPIRKNFAGIGYQYDLQRDAFIPPKPFNSWILNETTCLWEAPIPMPTDGIIYTWDEENQNWTLQNI